MKPTLKKYPKFQLQHHFEDALPLRMPGEPLRIVEDSIIVDYKTFKKSPAEKAQLKAAKAQSKYDMMKK